MLPGWVDAVRAAADLPLLVTALVSQWDWLSCFSQLTMQTAVNAAFFLDVY